MNKLLLNGLLTTTIALAGCAPMQTTTPPPPLPPRVLPPPAVDAPVPPAPPPLSQLPRYTCDQGIAFTVRFTNDSAIIDVGDKGREVLLRDAGGTTPQQKVFSNPRMRAEFGLGTTGEEAALRIANPPLQARCSKA